MTASKRPNNFTRVNDVPKDRLPDDCGSPMAVPGTRVIVDKYHEICMCQNCLTLLNAPGGNLPTCDCGTDELPIGADCRATINYADCIGAYLYIFVNWENPNLMKVVAIKENGVRSEYELIPNAAYLTKYYEVKDLDPIQRMMTEQYARMIGWIIEKVENVT